MVLIIVLLLIGFMIYSIWFHDENLPHPDVSNHPNLIVPQEHNFSFENPPVFEKEGSLRFIDDSTGSSISEIDIEIAENKMDRALGLMFRPEMKYDRGMLFIFDEERTQAFWMRNTIIPLDIIYVNSRMQIVDIYENTKTRSDESMPSKAPAIYVVEVNAGYCKEKGVSVGDYIDY